MCILLLYFSLCICLGVRTLRHQDTSAPVPKCPSVPKCWDTSAPVPKCLGHFGTDHIGSHACQRRQLRSGRGGELKAVDVYVPLSLNCGQLPKINVKIFHCSQIVPNLLSLKA